MFQNYFKTALRNLWKNKGFSAINIIGLAVGLATCLLIVLYVTDELSYDRWNNRRTGSIAWMPRSSSGEIICSWP